MLAATRGLSQQRYVLHRPLVPRHPPCALSSLTFLSSLDNERSNKERRAHDGGAAYTRDIARLVKMRRHARGSSMASRRHILMGRFGVEKTMKGRGYRWWRWAGSNCRPPACKAGALPAELHPRGTGRGPFWIRTRDLTVISRALSPTELKAPAGRATQRARRAGTASRAAGAAGGPCPLTPEGVERLTAQADV